MPRQLKCPRCAHVNVIADGAKPACGKCGFGTPGGAAPAQAPSSAGPSSAGPPSAGPPPSFGYATARTPAPAKPGIPPSTIVATALFGMAIVAMVLLQFSFLPFSTATLEQSGTVTEWQYGVWEVTAGEGAAAGSSGSHWDGARDGANGIELLRAGGPLLLASMAVVVLATVAVLLNKRGLANNCGWIAASGAACMVIVFALGVQAQQDEALANLGSTSAATLEYSWAAGFYVGIAAVALVVVGTIFAAMRVKAPAGTGAATQRPM